MFPLRSRLFEIYPSLKLVSDIAEDRASNHTSDRELWTES